MLIHARLLFLLLTKQYDFMGKKINVWDTYVTKKEGNIMHFDILVPAEITDTTTIYNYGKEYLKTKRQEGQPLNSEQCRLCAMSKHSAWSGKPKLRIKDISL